MTQDMRQLEPDKDPVFPAVYDSLADEFALAAELISARATSGLTQAEVAQRMGTSQSVVARLESGSQLPSLRTLQRYAHAIGYRAVVRLEAL